MAGSHWQIIQHHSSGRASEGRVEAVALDLVPPDIVRTAVRAARLIGDGFYGVDMKRIDRKCCVIEVNDNPNVDAGYEDIVMKDELYLRIMQHFLQRLEAKSRGIGSA
jgi:glutathione synthase/RimK-type ligase-like ATP-grasp enzyme